ncbi:MAG: LysR family transcriptional regulator [Pseudomonadota bacterium]
MDDLRALRVFLEVSRLQSFAGAARSLGLTAATVTREVARLEKELGQQLLLRTTRKVSLTSAGAVAAARYKSLVEDFDLASEDLRRAGLPDQGRLRINAPVSMGMRLLPGLLDAFRLAYPRIALEVTMTDTLIDVIEDTCDLAIRISNPPADKSTIWRKLCEVPRHAIAAPSLFLRHDRPSMPEDLPSALCLSYGTGPSAEVWEFHRGSTKRTVKASKEFTTNNGDLLFQLVRRGLGIAVLPGFIVDDAIQDGEIEKLLSDWVVAPLWLTLYYPPYEQLPPLVATFSDFFETYLRDDKADLFAWPEQR